MDLVIPNWRGHFIDYSTTIFLTGRFKRIIILNNSEKYIDDLNQIGIPYKVITIKRYLWEVLFSYRKIFLLDLNEHLFYSPFLRGFKYGLIYRYYLNNPIKTSINRIVLWFLKLKKVNLFILNQEYANFYKTPNYFHVVPELQKYDLSFTQEKENTPFVLHYGFLSERKGTILLLEASKFINKGKIILLGDIDDKIKNKVNDYIISSNNRVIHHLYKKETLEKLFRNCCGIIAPYSNTNQSSAIVELSIKLNIPIITLKGGFIGNRVDNYKLGITVNQNDLHSAINKVMEENIKTTLLEVNNESDFLDSIEKCLN